MLPKISYSIGFDGYVLDQIQGSLSWRHEPIALSRKTYHLLLYLIEHRDRVVTKDELLRELWPKRIAEDRNLMQQIFLLRKALGRHGDSSEIFATVPGGGYRFLAALNAVEQPAPTPVPSPQHPIAPFQADAEVEAEVVTTDRKHSTSPPAFQAVAAGRPFGTRAIVAIVAAILAGGAGFCAWRYWQSDAEPQRESVVVLAEFEVSAADDGLAAYLKEAVRNDLAESPFVTVISPSTVAKTLASLQKPDAPLLPVMARAVCARAPATAYLQGSVQQSPGEYAVSLRATNCVSGKLVAERNEHASQVDDLPHAIDLLVAKIRVDLGESTASVLRFDTPLLSRVAGAFDAFKAYSDARRFFDRGDFPASLPLFRRAVTIDRAFGMAYLDMAAAYYEMKDASHLREALDAAYSLREAIPESSRYLLLGFYHREITGDFAAALQSYKAWAELFPNSGAAADNLAEAYEYMGRSADAVAPGRRAMLLDPDNYNVQRKLASYELHGGFLKEARKTCERMISQRKDTPYIRDVLLNVLYSQHDSAGVETQLTWGRRRNSPLQLVVDEVMLALARGQISAAKTLTAQLKDSFQPSALESSRQTAMTQISRMLADYDLGDDGFRMLPPAGLFEPDEDSLVTLAESGRVAQAEDALQGEKSKHQQDFLWSRVKEPEVKAAIFLANHKADDAMHALTPALAFDGLSFGPIYLRGRAYMEIGDVEHAAREFQKIVEHGFIDSLSNLYPLALLQLARLSGNQRNIGQAGKYYRELLEIWRNADANFPLVIQARREFATII